MSFKKYKIKKIKEESIVDETLQSFKEKYISARKRNLFSGVLLGLLGVSIIGVFAFFTFAKISNFSLDFNFLSMLNISGFSSIDPQKEKINILLTGMGGGVHDGAELTDTIILASINTKKKTVTMLSIPRDLYVEYPSSGALRINELYAKGKKAFSETKAMEYLKDKVEQITGEKTDYFLNIDFAGFTKFVDLLGGVEINVPDDLVDKEYPDNNWGYETFSIKKGLQTLDGTTALKYARSRHSTNDFDRSLRQQLVIKSIKTKLLDLNYIGNPSKLKALFYTLNTNIKTDMGVKEIIGIASIAKGLPNDNIFSFNLNTSCEAEVGTCDTGGFLYNADRSLFNGAAVILPEDATAQDISNYSSIIKFANLIFNYPEIFKEKSEINFVNSTKVSGLANKFATYLKKYGFNIPEKDSILSVKEKNPKTKIYYIWNEQTKYGVNPQSKTLEALGQFFFSEPIKENDLKFSKSPGTKIEILLGDDYKLFLNK